MIYLSTHYEIFCCIKRGIGIIIICLTAMLMTACDMAPANVEYKVKSQLDTCAEINCEQSDCANIKRPESLNEKCDEQR